MKYKITVLVGIGIALSLLLGCCVAAIILTCYRAQQPSISNQGPLSPPYTFSNSWTSQHNIVAHALGSINQDTYTNSREAFDENYEKGQRVFEVDMDVTVDGTTIASHDEQNWRNQAEIPTDMKYTVDNFKDSLIYQKYHTLDYKDIVDLMAEHPDIYIVTDSKYYDVPHVNWQFSQIRDYAKERSPEVLDRIIPQIYNEDMLEPTMAVYPWKSIIFTLYQTQWTPESVLAFCQKTGVKFITMWDYLLTPEIAKLWNENGIQIAVHSVNDRDKAIGYLHSGASVIYTDFLLERDFLK